MVTNDDDILDSTNAVYSMSTDSERACTQESKGLEAGTTVCPQDESSQETMARSKSPFDPLKAVPIEIGLRILAYITSPRMLSQLGAVSSYWKVLAWDDVLWQHLCERRWRYAATLSS